MEDGSNRRKWKDIFGYGGVMSGMRLVELGKEFVENKISAEGFSDSIVKE
ncbi:hypothetical protein FKD06_25230 [Serratia sp. SRS-8-S-2018]|nr:hypothetical protein FKD06_25230 [Serratia sp. SRS-8-S-2018]